jgi:hypothetical protein
MLLNKKRVPTDARASVGTLYHQIPDYFGFAGLLALGSSALCGLPTGVDPGSDQSLAIAKGLADYSGGSATDLHRVPVCLKPNIGRLYLKKDYVNHFLRIEHVGDDFRSQGCFKLA